MDLNRFSINKLRYELYSCYYSSEQRCLRRSCEWTQDLLAALPEEGEEKVLSKLEHLHNNIAFNPQYHHARACFELQEYDRAAYLVRDQDDDVSRFLYYFAMYKAAEKKRIDLMNEISVTIPKKAMLKFDELRDSLERSMDKKEPDGWLLYVYGLVLHKFKLHKCAVEVLERAINLTPLNWSAWFVLSTLIDSKEKLHDLKLPNHLFKVFFYWMMRLDLDMPSSEPWLMVSCKETETFLDKYFTDSLFIKTLTAKSLGPQSHKESLATYEQVRADDPHRIDLMDNLSYLLFVSKNNNYLAKLACQLQTTDPLTPEANLAIAMSFTAREQHHKAVYYLTRALRLHPEDYNSWTVIGHEYSEMKCFDKALQAYRFAISINKRDCRAWLGLGNTYEVIMSSPNVPHPNYQHCLYYYSQVSKYKPTDPIMFQAMAGIFEKMKLIPSARLCLMRAGADGLSRLSELDQTCSSDNDCTT